MRHMQAISGQPPAGFVYVMEAGGFYKIGWSASPEKRLSGIQTGCPLKVTLVGVIEGTRDDEASWHACFREKRQFGEWFALSEADVSTVLQESWGIGNLPGEFDIA